MNKYSKKAMLFMRRALTLAKRGNGTTAPNPMVGAVIVKNDTIIGEGWHQKAGSDHAEIRALRKCKTNTEGATMYLTLEPCCFIGKTPPCTKALIKAGIKKVFIATHDPNPQINGKGIKELQKAGIVTNVGFLRKEAQNINEVFFTVMQKKRPFVILKFAMTLDGKIATKTGDSKYITGEKTQNYTHRLRKKHNAILVGINTVIKDNPHLGCRLIKGKDPLRIIIDPHLKTPLESEILRNNNFLIITSKKTQKISLLENKGGKVLIMKKINLKKIMRYLLQQGITSILVEGGSETHAHFLNNMLYDKIYAFIGPKIIGGKKALSPIGGKGIAILKNAYSLKITEVKRLASDILIVAYPML